MKSNPYVPGLSPSSSRYVTKVLTVMSLGFSVLGSFGAVAAPSATAPQIPAAQSATSTTDADICHTPTDISSGTTQRSVVPVSLPAVKLRSHQGQPLSLNEVLADPKPVLLNFIFTSCTTVCPPMSQIFAATQDMLGGRRNQVQMVSISIDPEHDSPARLRDYAARFAADSQWRFFTGSTPAIDAIQRAFNVYRPDKMGHTPVTFIRPRVNGPWIRVDGFSSPDVLVREALGAQP